MNHSKIKEYLTTLPDSKLMTDFILLLVWGVIIGSFIGVLTILLRWVIG